MYLVAFLQLLPCFTENEDGEQTVHLILPSIFHQRQLDREARTPSDLTTLLTSSILLLPCFLMKEDGFSNNLHQGNLLESKNIVKLGYPSSSCEDRLCLIDFLSLAVAMFPSHLSPSFSYSCSWDFTAWSRLGQWERWGKKFVVQDLLRAAIRHHLGDGSSLAQLFSNRWDIGMMLIYQGSLDERTSPERSTWSFKDKKAFVLGCDCAMIQGSNPAFFQL